MIPDWDFYIDGSHLLGPNAVIYSALNFTGYPNHLTRSNTDFVPIDLSLLNNDNLLSTALTVDISGKLTRIFHGNIGITARFLGKGDLAESAFGDSTPLDNRSFYPTIHIGTQTRFYRNLWWTIRVTDYPLYKSEQVGTAALFENEKYFETEILFLGL